MIELAIATGLKFIFVAAPLFLSLASGQRALNAERSQAACLYVAYAGFAAVVGTSNLFWAMGFSAPNSGAAFLVLGTLGAWPCLLRIQSVSEAAENRSASLVVEKDIEPEPVEVERQENIHVLTWEDLPFIPAEPGAQLGQPRLQIAA